jgi:hypothetical protein
MDKETENAEDTTLASPTVPDTEISPIPRKRKLRGRNKTKRTLVAADKRTKLKANSPFFGMTQMKCADACTPSACVISGMAYCAHPYKGGLQRQDIAAINRLNDAKTFLGPPKRI